MRSILGVAAALLLAITLSGIAVANNGLSALMARQLSDVEEATISAQTSCGLRTVAIDYHGARWHFELASDGSDQQPWWTQMWEDVMVRVGRLDGEVWAIAPDGSRWRLLRSEEASLFCLW
jgi:hypothetical protein